VIYSDNRAKFFKKNYTVFIKFFLGKINTKKILAYQKRNANYNYLEFNGKFQMVIMQPCGIIKTLKEA
jgi:hypothetical protein